MGIFINLAVSRRVTQSEWTKVYEETLRLVEAFPLAEIESIEVGGVKTTGLIRTREHAFSSWDRFSTHMGWRVSGDYETLRTAEDNALYRDLSSTEGIAEGAADAMQAVYDYQHQYDRKSKDYGIHRMFGNKTQGEPHHIYLLAVACLVESRLGDAAFVHGDITAGQCRRAVALANQYLEKPIGVPSRCDMERLGKRVARLPLCESDKVRMFMELYLGAINGDLGDYLRSTFSEEALHDYWQEQFQTCEVANWGHAREVKQYLMTGFSLTELAHMAASAIEGEDQAKSFVRSVMNLKLHVKEKDTRDALEIDQDEDDPYSVYTIFAQFVFGSLRNRAIDRYIPIEVVRQDLAEALGSCVDVNEVIDEYIKQEAEQAAADKVAAEVNDVESLSQEAASHTFNDAIQQRLDELQETYDTYDIADFEGLLFYKKGDSIKPVIQKNLEAFLDYCQRVRRDDEFKELMEQSPEERFEWLVHTNHALLLRDVDWEAIHRAVMASDNAFARYYPVVRMSVRTNNLYSLACAVMINDALYEHLDSFNQPVS